MADEASSATPRKTRKTGPVSYEVYRVGQGTLQPVGPATAANDMVYRVGQGTLQFVGPATAANDIKAITEALGERPQPGKYIAIPTRDLRVREVGTETQVKVVIT